MGEKLNNFKLNTDFSLWRPRLVANFLIICERDLSNVIQSKSVGGSASLRVSGSQLFNWTRNARELKVFYKENQSKSRLPTGLHG